MSSILRSSKFFKYLNSFNKNLAVSSKCCNAVLLKSSNVGKFDARLCLSNLARQESKYNNIEKYIRRLDQEVRRSGRVSIKELKDVIAEMKLSNQASSAQSLMIIRCCGNLLPQETAEVRLQLVDDVLNTIISKGLALDISHYNALLMVYLENDHKFSPLELLEKLNKEGVEPNRVTFQRLIAAYCQQGNIDGATRILEFMKEKQMPISENIFNSLITGHSQANDMESAKGTLGVMQQANVEASSDTYAALLCGYAKNCDMDGITEVFELAETKDIRFNDKQLLEIIYHLAINGNTKLIEIILPRLSCQSGYNQDAKNTILRLIAKDCDEAALKVFKTMTPISLMDRDPLPLGSFVIRQLVNMNRPFEKIKAFCDSLIESKENERAFYYAIESSLITKKTELSLKLISALAKVEPVCQHYYWPVLCQYAKNNNVDGIIKTLKQMSFDMNMAVPNETLREYVVESIGPNEKGIVFLRQAGITVASAASAVVAYHLGTNNMASAAIIASKYRANYNIAPIKRSIVQAFKQSQDLDSLILLVRCCLSYSKNTGNNEISEAGENSEDQKDIMDLPGSLLIGIASSYHQNRSEIINEILKGYLEYGIGVSPSNAEVLQDTLSGSDLTPEISGLLAKLTSPDITFVPIQKAGPAIKSVSFDKDKASLLEAIEMCEAKEQPSDIYKIQLMMLYCKQQDYAMSAQIQQELDDKKVDIPGDYLVQLLSICVNNESLSEAESFYKQILSMKDKIPISEQTLVKLATLYVQADRLDEALKIFETHKQNSLNEKDFSYSSTIWKLLNMVAETGNGDNVEKLFYTMKDCNFLIPTNVLLGPLIKVHLVKNDLKKALEKFEEFCVGYRVTPWKNELACKLIQAEDAASLQKLTDLSSNVHGEVNCLYDLVLSFIECGRMRQARKILETPGLRTRHSRLSSACLRYQNEGHITYLKNLVEVTKDLPHIDRADLYYHLLGSYCNNDEVDKAIGLWTQMQEEDVQPTDRFLVKLATLLKKHDRPIPFSTPTSKTSDRLHLLQKSSEETAQLRAYRKALYDKDIDKALQIKESMLDTDLMTSDRSILLSMLINSGRLGEAAKLLTQWLEQGLRPNIRTLNYMINSMAKTGDVKTLQNIGNLLDDDLKKLTSFSNRLTHCMVQAGKSEEVIQSLEKEIEAANTPDKILECQKKFPRGGIFSILDSSPDLTSRVENLALKCKEKGILEPMNILWIYYFVNKNKDKEAEIWPTIKSLERIMYQPILKKAQGQRDIELVTELLNRCRETTIGKGALGVVYSCILDIHVWSERIEECKTQLDEALKVVSLENLSTGSLKRIKNALESNGELFKYTIPVKTRRSFVSSSSNSDSDDEVRQKA